MSDAHNKVLTVLERNRARMVALHRARASATAWIVLGCLFGATLALDYTFRLGTAGRILSCLLHLAVAGGVSWVWLLPALRYRPSLLDVALAHERVFPQFNALLVTLVDAPRGAETFHRQVAEEAGALCRQLPVEQIVQWQAHRRLWSSASVIAVGWLLLVLFWPGGVWTWAVRSFAPWADRHWPTRTRIVLDEVPERVRRGDAIQIVGRCEGRVPRRATVYYRRQSSGSWRRMDVPVDVRGRFESLITPALYDVELYVAAGDGHGERHTVPVVIPPEVEHLLARVTPPVYSRLLPFQQEDGRIEALIGSQVSIIITPSRPAQTATLRLQRGEERAMTAAGGVWSATFSLDAEDRYEIVLTDRYGYTSDNRPTYDLLPIADTVPAVTLRRPQGEKRVTPLSRLRIEAVGEDDYGVTEAALVWRPEKSGTEKRVPLALGAGRAVETVFDWDLASTGAQPGDRLVYWIEMGDAGLHPQPPVRGQSVPGTLSVIDAETLTRELQSEIAAQFARLEDLERALVHSADEIARLGNAAPADLATALRAEQWRHEDAQRRLVAAKGSLIDLADDLAASFLATPAEIESLRNVAAQLQMLASGSTENLLAVLRSTRSQIEGETTP